MKDEIKPPNNILNIAISAVLSTVISLIINKISHLNVNIIILVLFLAIFLLAIYYAFYWHSQAKTLFTKLSYKNEKLADAKEKLKEEKKLNDDFADEIRDLQSRNSTLHSTDESPLLKIKKMRDKYNFSSKITQD